MQSQLHGLKSIQLNKNVSKKKKKKDAHKGDYRGYGKVGGRLGWEGIKVC